MATQLYADPVVPELSMEALHQQLGANTLTQPRILSPIMNGSMQGTLSVGSSTVADAGIDIDGNNIRIVMKDGTTNRLVLGQV